MSKPIIVGFEFYNNSGNERSSKCHVVAVNSIQSNLLIVTYRYWLKTKKYWVYKTDELDDFNYCIEIGLFTLDKVKPSHKE